MMADEVPDNAFQQILDFLQPEIIYYFDKVAQDKKKIDIRQPAWVSDLMKKYY